MIATTVTTIESALPRLTPRERQVLDLLCLRLTDREIAERLSIGVRTVESHVASILRTLGTTSRREAAVTLQARMASPYVEIGNQRVQKFHALAAVVAPPSAA